MLFGASRTAPTPKAKDDCPICGTELLAKCGSVVSWHGAHATTRDCDSWAEPITDWHLEWQDVVAPHRQEIVLGNHRADMVLPSGIICEVQHSPINAADIAEREKCYRNMIWILDGREAFSSGRLEPSRSWTYMGREYTSLYWKWRKRAAWTFTKQVYIDVGHSIFRFDGFYEGIYSTDRFTFKAQRLDRLRFEMDLRRHHKSSGSRMEAYYDDDRDRVRWRYE